MPLYAYAAELITYQLQDISAGRKVGIIAIGEITDAQHSEINRLRAILYLPPLESPELVYLGRHHYNSRSHDGYSIEEMLIQVEHACCAASVVRLNRAMSSIQNVAGRRDGDGNTIRDMAVLELTARKPRAEVFSVVPKGDRRKAKGPD